MAQMTIPSDLYVSGNVASKSLSVPAGSVTDASIVAAAGVQSSKLEHRFEKHYAQESATTSASEARVVHRVRGATATIIDFVASIVVACAGAATITFDLLKNGASILTSVITVDNTVTAYTVKVAAGFTSTSLAQNDVLEVKITATAGGGTLGKGAHAQVNLREDAQ